MSVAVCVIVKGILLLVVLPGGYTSKDLNQTQGTFHQPKSRFDSRNYPTLHHIRRDSDVLLRQPRSHCSPPSTSGGISPFGFLAFALISLNTIVNIINNINNNNNNNNNNDNNDNNNNDNMNMNMEGRAFALKEDVWDFGAFEDEVWRSRAQGGGGGGGEGGGGGGGGGGEASQAATRSEMKRCKCHEEEGESPGPWLEGLAGASEDLGIWAKAVLHQYPDCTYRFLCETTRSFFNQTAGLLVLSPLRSFTLGQVLSTARSNSCDDIYARCPLFD